MVELNNVKIVFYREKFLFTTHKRGLMGSNAKIRFSPLNICEGWGLQAEAIRSYV